MKLNDGKDLQAWQMAGRQGGDVGSATTGMTSTVLTDGGKSWSNDQWIGHVVVASNAANTAIVFGNVVDNDATTLTVDRWYTAGSSDTAATTPGSGYPYAILPSASTARYLGISNDNTAPVATDTSLAGEITGSTAGLYRKRATFAHTAATSTYTLSATWTANANDTLPVTIYKAGVFTSAVQGQGTCQFAGLFSSSSTLSAVDDQITVTVTVTM